VHPVLSRTFAALDDERVRWCLLRGHTELDAHEGDVDLLIHTDDRGLAERALARLAFMPLAAWGRGTHRFFLTYDAADGAWLKLDTVSALAYGPHGTIDTRAAEGVLARRVLAGGLWLPMTTDRFWALLLHCMLDRGAIPERHAATLSELAPRATDDGPLAAWFRRHAPPGWPPERAIDMARAGAWATLVHAGHDIVKSEHRRSGRQRSVHAARAAARRMTKLRKLLLERGMSVALMGPDGAGKSTVATGLAEGFYFPIHSIYMGLFSKDRISGRPPSGVLEHLTRLAGHLGRQWKAYLESVAHRMRGRLVVYDRFAYDAVLREPRRSWIGGRLRRWILAHAVPSPDVVVILDAPADVLHARKGEHDLSTLESQRQAYMRLARRLPNAHVVRTDRSADEIRRDVVGLIWQHYVARRRRGRTDRSR
jgi:thymidylate kinase